MSTIVVMPGGFHPFHAGHKALHESAMQAFPGASMYIAATNDTKTRPFPFAVKEKLAKVAGVPSGQFVQVKSPFQPREITSQFDPNSDVLIFVRSEKDKNESPTPGGTKKDGSPNYFQPYTEGQLQPFGKHAYMAYLPTVEFGPGMTSATEIRDAWTTLDTRRKTALVMSLYPATQKNKRLANVVVRLLDSALGGAQPMNEGLMWSDFDRSLSVDDKLTILEQYLLSKTQPLSESNDPKMADYFISLTSMSDMPKKNSKMLMLFLGVLNNKLIQLNYPEIVTVLSQNGNEYTVQLADGSVKEFPSKSIREKLVAATFLFDNDASFDKFRTIMSLKFDFDFFDYESYGGGAEPMNEGQDLLQVPNNIANTVAELLNHKKPDLFTRYGPEYTMNIIQDVCADAPTKSIMELAIETLQRLKQKTGKSVNESRIMHRNALVNAFYVSPKGDSHRVAENIPYYLLDKLVPLLTKKYAITMNDIEVRPVDSNQYHRTSQPEMKEGAMKPTHVSGEEKSGAVETLEKALLKAKERGVKLNYDRIDKMMQLICKEHNLTGDKLHDDFVEKHQMIPDNWIKQQSIEENLGLPMPGTYEQEYDMYKTHGGPKRITALTTEDSGRSDREVDTMLRFAQQHYPEADKQQAFMKFVLHALKHSEQDDARQDAELQNLDHEVDHIEHEVDDIEQQVNVTESTDYLDEK